MSSWYSDKDHGTSFRSLGWLTEPRERNGVFRSLSTCKDWNGCLFHNTILIPKRINVSIRRCLVSLPIISASTILFFFFYLHTDIVQSNYYCCLMQLACRNALHSLIGVAFLISDGGVLCLIKQFNEVQSTQHRDTMSTTATCLTTPLDRSDLFTFYYWV